MAEVLTIDACNIRLGLERFPRDPSGTLRAWDAADEYLLGDCSTQAGQGFTARNILLVNDSFGALAIALQGIFPSATIHSWSDSYLAGRALEANLRSNGVNTGQICFHCSVDLPMGDYDLIILKVPKQLAMLDYQLSAIVAAHRPDQQVLAAGMTKYLSRGSIALLQDYYTAVQASRAHKKARILYLSEPSSAARREGLNSGPTCYSDPELGFSLSNHANLFSRDRLDLGARNMLACFGQLPGGARRVVDLGCGNGVLGIMARRSLGQGEYLFVDESVMAIDSAKQNFRKVYGHQDGAEFRLDDCLSQTLANGWGTSAGRDADWILCNPPFHQGQAINDRVAKRMFRHAQRLLKPGGEFWVVANRHLGYQRDLRRLFGYCEQLGGDRKFVVLRAVRAENIGKKPEK